LIVFRGRTAWFHSINSSDDVSLLFGYVERMLLAETYLEPPAELTGRYFERYIGGSEPSSQCFVERESAARV